MNTIRSYLALMLVAAFALVCFLAALNGYRESMLETERLMDTQLLNNSQLLMISNHRSDQKTVALSANSNLAFQVWQNNELQHRSDNSPLVLINSLSGGFSAANFSGYRWRTFTRQGEEGRWIIVAERSDLRYLLAEKVALSSVLPLLLWLPASAFLVWWLIGVGLSPLKSFSKQIQTKRSDDLNPINYQNPPKELVDVIESTNDLLSRLSASFEREKHFASHAAHELRTPISILKVHLHNLAEDLPKGHQGLAHANAGIERMQHLVEQILDLNRTNPDIIEEHFSMVDLHAVTQQVIASAWPMFAEKNQTVSLQGDSLSILGDKGLLETLLQNLIDNASKYTPEEGEIEVVVKVIEKQCQRFAQLAVIDSGCGIASQNRDAVFARFYRQIDQHDNNQSGSGLGLAIVQHIVELHHAKVHLADSHFESGLQVTIDFPINESKS